ncbi:MAG: 4-hydroxybenzoate octaprenyltransferase [Alphaproteobacteria bacterium]|nr:4-hydroxybenzoate octaprenyltransferase [Alphaproteobacteria bacterium]
MTPDALPNHWTLRHLPGWALHCARLARLDRPIGTWLLLWPCWWSIALAAVEQGSGWGALGLPDPVLLALFALGAVAMRGAGCVLNDIVDRDFDARVARTRARPLPSGQVSLPQAVLFMIGLALIGLAVLLSLNGFAFWVGVASLPLIALYPFMKRISDWPQAVLGLTFNWGALLGWAAATGALTLPPLVLYAAGLLWTLGYDTIYAHQDKEDDALIGVRSTALKFGAASRRWIAGFYGGAVILFALAGAVAGVAWPFYPLLGMAALQLAWQTWRVRFDAPASCLAVFRSNTLFGALVFAAILAGQVAR